MGFIARNRLPIAASGAVIGAVLAFGPIDDPAAPDYNDGKIVGHVTLPKSEPTHSVTEYEEEQAEQAAVIDQGGDRDLAAEADEALTAWLTDTATDTPFVEDVIFEDDPRWDCRVMGNMGCGVDVMGDGYVIWFEDGQPTHVTPLD